ncbi:MAG: nucleotidyltransferase family protein [Magnetococcales bacterium]|nr:nucleotidyltransferase family protein [Magnetococcales bacterium]
MLSNATFDQSAIHAFCEHWKITELALFGSVLRASFSPESDVDVLVSFAGDARWTLFDMTRMQEELQEIFGRRVDLVSRRGIESSQNVQRRRAILESAEPLYPFHSTRRNGWPSSTTKRARVEIPDSGSRTSASTRRST